MNTWYDRGTFYHMYPLGMTGALRSNQGSGITHRFNELNQWIPHMASLGCNAVYIGPLFESSTHGYDTVDYRLVDRRLGDHDDFKQFVSRCHEAGIKVVVDGVFNHTGRGFFAFTDLCRQGPNSPYKDWYKGVNFDWNSPLGDNFGYESWQGHYELPCLNLQNREVRQYLLESVRFWVDEFGIDGIRLDCANVLDFQFMQELRHFTDQIKEDFWLMGEVIHGDYSRWVNRETLHSVTNYELHKSLYSGLNDHNFFEIAHNVRRLEAIGTYLYTFLDNHDENRIASKLNDQAHLPLAYLLLFTLPGIPSVYYGSEWGLKGVRSNTSDDDLRPAVAAAELPERATALTAYIAELAKIHQSYQEFHGGRYQELVLTNRQYAYARHAAGSAVIIAANSDDREAVLSIPLPLHTTAAVNLSDSSILPVTGSVLPVTLPGNSGIILQIKEG